MVAVASFAFSQPQTTADGKINTQIKFLGETTVKNGDDIQLELKEVNGNGIANQKLNISYSKNGIVENYSVTTDNNGKAYFSIDTEEPGNAEITVVYGGNDKYNGCTSKESITIVEGTSSNTQQVPVNSSTSTSLYNKLVTNQTNNTNQTNGTNQSGQLFYNSEYNFYYNTNGIVVGGQSDGAIASDLYNSYRESEISGSTDRI